MKNTLLIIFVEGLSDELFVKDIVKKRRPDICIKIYKYAKKPKEDIVKYIKALNKMNDNSFTYYLFLADNDSCKYPQQKIDIECPNIRQLTICMIFLSGIPVILLAITMQLYATIISPIAVS